ncbi:unnamed protein product [Closterium sp. NIES-65]|nr:unnamed protein product [Closterium sp. NIES-65]
MKLPDYLTGGLLTLATLLCLCCSSDGLTPTSPLLTPSSSPLSCIGACVLFCLRVLWAAEEELYGEKILSVDSLTSGGLHLSEAPAFTYPIVANFVRITWTCYTLNTLHN